MATPAPMSGGSPLSSHLLEDLGSRNSNSTGVSVLGSGNSSFLRRLLWPWAPRLTALGLPLIRP
ncbi:rCG53847 [Rattus norvegicus]|uniref:RCG53847 n=1 Tax=Rattus norvegicus TaxID=10116 RepID=A6JA79_RAT|nr:rCG53847 [Rattus norvegicus]